MDMYRVSFAFVSYSLIVIVGGMLGCEDGVSTYSSVETTFTMDDPRFDRAGNLRQSPDENTAWMKTAFDTVSRGADEFVDECPSGTGLIVTVLPGGVQQGCAKVGETGSIVKHGPWVAWWPGSDIVAWRGGYRDGVQHGTWIYWHTNRQKWMIGEFEDGKKVGRWIDWRKSGHKWTDGEFLDGVENGKWTFWYENGAKSQEGDYLAGKKHGAWKQWGIDGTLLGEVKLDQGNGLWTEWYDNGQKKLEGEYRDGKVVGNWKRWDRND